MIDHLELQTRSIGESVRFYSEVLNPLGYVRKLDGPAQGFGAGHDTDMDLFLVEGEPSANVHFALRRAPGPRLIRPGPRAATAGTRSTGRPRSHRTSIRITTPVTFGIQTVASSKSSARRPNDAPPSGSILSRRQALGGPAIPREAEKQSDQCRELSSDPLPGREHAKQ
jgi:hypothetical protein